MTSSAPSKKSRAHKKRTSIVAETTRTQVNRAPEIIIGAGNLTLRGKLWKPRSRPGRRSSDDRRIPFFLDSAAVEPSNVLRDEREFLPRVPRLDGSPSITASPLASRAKMKRPPGERGFRCWCYHAIYLSDLNIYGRREIGAVLWRACLD